MKKRLVTVCLLVILAAVLWSGSALAGDEDFIIRDGVLKWCMLNGHYDEVWIPDGVTTIGSEVFLTDNTSCQIEDLYLPSSVTTISDSAFSGAYIKNIHIPSSVTSIGEDAFNWCRNLCEW